MLVDALLYAQNFGPKFIVDIGTLSTDIEEALGTVSSGIYTNSEELWQQIKNASSHTGDRVWRMPLWKHYTKQVCASKTVDVQNVGIGRDAGSCKAAAILREFVPCGQWMHIVKTIND